MPEEDLEIQDPIIEETPVEEEVVEEVVEEPAEIEPEIRREKVVAPKDTDDPVDEEIESDDERIISKVVDRRLREAGVGDVRDQVEVDSFIRDNPDYNKYRKTMLKYMSNPSYSNIPAHNIAAIVASKDQQMLGAAKERAATLKVNETKDGGNTIRKVDGGGVDWGKVSPDDFEAQRAKVLGRNL